MKSKRLSYASDFRGEEFKFIIKISSKKYAKDLEKLQAVASKRFPDNFKENNESILKPFIVNMAYECVSKTAGDNSIEQMYVSNYSQNKGSIIIKFSLFIFYILREYGAIRTGIEYFKNDFEKFVKKALPGASVTFTETKKDSLNLGCCNDVANLTDKSDF